MKSKSILIHTIFFCNALYIHSLTPEKYIALCQCLSAIFFCVWQSAIFLAKKIQSAISKKVEELDLVDSIFGCKIC